MRGLARFEPVWWQEIFFFWFSVHERHPQKRGGDMWWMNVLLYRRIIFFDVCEYARERGGLIHELVFREHCLHKGGLDKRIDRSLAWKSWYLLSMPWNVQRCVITKYHAIFPDTERLFVHYLALNFHHDPNFSTRFQLCCRTLTSKKDLDGLAALLTETDRWVLMFVLHEEVPMIQWRGDVVMW
jgi:hypothetical protein